MTQRTGRPRTSPIIGISPPPPSAGHTNRTDPHTRNATIRAMSDSTHTQSEWSAARIRQTFIDFFAQKPTQGSGNGHTFFPSSPVVPHDDPTLLFANAGMNQYKPIFLGQADPATDLGKLARATNSQKCIRAGGKHNDLEDVGKDTYHHTFFEMLGNWSFGDYFKEETIAWAWESLTVTFGINPERLYATYFGGDPDLGLEPDNEARDLWLRFLPPERVLPFDMKDNFWEMGDTGPCGPCSEIHYDRIGNRDAGPLVNMDDPDVIEIWNLVFIQYNRESATSLIPLPAKHVDTGMGLERLASVLQNVRSNYDTDLFTPIFKKLQQLTGARPYTGKLGADDTDGVDMAYRVIADHIRTLTFALTDGAVPDKDGRGYVLRRVLRRAVRFGRQKLNAPPGFLTELADTVMEQMAGAFPELAKDPARVKAIIAEEEESFGKTLDRGVKLFEQAAAEATSNQISGANAFQLYDTFGFPVDLTQLMAEERGLTVDMPGFEAEMARQKEQSRGDKFGGQADPMFLQPETLALLKGMSVSPTNDQDKFHGRDIKATVKAIWNGKNFDENATAAEARPQHPIGVLLDTTSFYAEMGGQVADTGRVFVMREARRSASDAHQGGEFRVEAVKSFGSYVLHIGHVVRGELRVGDDVQTAIDHAKRAAIAANHTATHLLNLGLRQHVSPDADQKGSLVNADKLRFDFALAGATDADALAKAEQLVKDAISANLTVHTDAAPLDQAKQINALRAVFGEVYPDPVRVVSVGAPIDELLARPDDQRWSDHSIEFCGGTHVETTSDIGAFAIIQEEPVAKGIRRISALTGVPAQAAIQAADELATRIERAPALPDDTLPREVNDLVGALDSLTLPAPRKHELRGKLVTLQERVKAAAKQAAAGRAKAAVESAKAIATAAAAELDNELVIHSLDAGSDRKALQQAVKTIMDHCPKSGVMLLSPDSDEQRVSIIAVVPKNLQSRGLKAGDWVRTAAEACGGKGGGKPDAAQGGGTDPTKVTDAITAARRYGTETLMG